MAFCAMGCLPFIAVLKVEQVRQETEVVQE